MSQQLFSILHGHDLLFDDESWRTIPYLGTLKTPVNYLYDIGDRVVSETVKARKINTSPSAEDVYTLGSQAPNSTTDGLSCMLEINQSLDCWLNQVKHQHRNALYIPKQAELWCEIQPETLATPYDFSNLEIAAIVNVYVRSSRISTESPLLMLTGLLTSSSGFTNF